MAQLSVIRAEILLRLRDQGSRVVTNGNVDTLINDALEEFVNATEEIRQENAFAVTAKQFDIAAPSDIIKPISAMWMPTQSPIEIVSHHEFLDRGGYNLIESGVPQFMMMEGTSSNYRFRLFPAPASTSATTTILDTGGINSSVTTIGVAAVSGLRLPAGWLLIESEKILYQNYSTLDLTLVRRGMAGTTAASHADLVAVTQLDLHVIYARKAATLSADGDIPEIDARWHKALVYKVLSMALKLEGRVDEAEIEEGLYQKAVTDARRNIRRVQGASPSAISGNFY